VNSALHLASKFRFFGREFRITFKEPFCAFCALNGRSINYTVNRHLKGIRPWRYSIMFVFQDWPKEFKTTKLRCAVSSIGLVAQSAHATSSSVIRGLSVSPKQ
jgi:hypothetical protein